MVQVVRNFGDSAVFVHPAVNVYGIPDVKNSVGNESLLGGWGVADRLGFHEPENQ